MCYMDFGDDEWRSEDLWVAKPFFIPMLHTGSDMATLFRTHSGYIYL